MTSGESGACAQQTKLDVLFDDGEKHTNFNLCDTKIMNQDAPNSTEGVSVRPKPTITTISQSDSKKRQTWSQADVQEGQKISRQKSSAWKLGTRGPGVVVASMGDIKLKQGAF